MLNIFDVQVGIKYFGDAIIARVRVDGEYRYGEFCTILGLITWIENNQRLLRDSLARKERPRLTLKDESQNLIKEIQDLIKEIQDLLDENEPIIFEERLAA